jgi:TRAP-type C4-dicarboxylate transport system permease small subunit
VRRSHVGVDYLLNIVPERYLRPLSVALAVLLLGFLGFLAYWGAEFVRLNWSVPLYTTSALTLGMAYAAVPVGAMAMMIGVLLNATLLWNLHKHEEEGAQAGLVGEI